MLQFIGVIIFCWVLVKIVLMCITDKEALHEDEPQKPVEKKKKGLGVGIYGHVGTNGVSVTAGKRVAGGWLTLGKGGLKWRKSKRLWKF